MRKILWYAFLLIPAVFTSCNLEDDSGLIPQENRKLTISFSVQDPASGLATRAAIAPEAGEENIKTLDLIFFESNGNGTGTFKGWKELTSASDSPLEMNTDIVFDFSDIGLKTTDAYDILAIANMVRKVWTTGKTPLRTATSKQPGRKYRLLWQVHPQISPNILQNR